MIKEYPEDPDTVYQSKTQKTETDFLQIPANKSTMPDSFLNIICSFSFISHINRKAALMFRHLL